jgi:predicted nucleotidyltransferase
MTTQSIQSIKKQIVPILKRQGVTKAALFGSVARGDVRKKSDIDLLIKLQRNKSLLDFMGLKIELEEKLNKKVDLLTYDALHPLLKDRILNEQKVIYESRRKRS